jgi:hypothetical protein
VALVYANGEFIFDILAAKVLPEPLQLVRKILQTFGLRGVDDIRKGVWQNASRPEVRLAGLIP